VIVSPTDRTAPPVPDPHPTLPPTQRKMTMTDLHPPIENAYVVPGTRLIAGEYPGSPPSNATTDLAGKLAQFLDAGVDAFVDLTAAADGLAPYEPTLQALAEQRGTVVQYDMLTITDMSVCDDEHMERVLDLIDAHLAAGRTPYVHCWGGIGRTGTVVGCWLVRHGMTGDAALAEVTRLFETMSPKKVRRHRAGGSPQTHEQREMVRNWTSGEIPHVTLDELKAPSRYDEFHAARDAARLHTRIRGCLLGGALGDALGWPVEFLSLAEIRRSHGEQGMLGPDATVPSGFGAVTDDTQMTIFTAEGILRSTTRFVERSRYSDPSSDDWPGWHTAHPGVMRSAYQRWLHTQGMVPAGYTAPRLDTYPGWLVDVPALHARRAPGNTCVGALRASFETSAEQCAANDSKGCGGVMRVAPIGLVPSEDPFGYAVMAAGLTHGHPSGYLSAGAYAQILSDLRHARTPSLRAAIAHAIVRLRRETGHEETVSALELATALADEPGPPTAERVETLGAGWTGEEALAIGVYCALVATDFAHGVRLAVNHSGDSDSTGSIAGAILGVQCGEYGLPSEWLARLELRDVISAVADDLLVGYGGGPTWRARYPGN